MASAEPHIVACLSNYGRHLVAEMVNCKKILDNVLREKSSLSPLGILNTITKTQFSKMEKLLECLCVFV